MLRGNKGFTLIELLIVVAIIGILASIVLVAMMSAARNKAAVNSYKTSVDSVRAGAEICYQSGATINSNVAPGGSLCSAGSTTYPTITDRCGGVGNFVANNPSSVDWEVTTESGCRGCRLLCNTEGCSQIEDSPGDCY